MDEQTLRNQEPEVEVEGHMPRSWGRAVDQAAGHAESDEAAEVEGNGLRYVPNTPEADDEPEVEGHGLRYSM